jgi:hypothetical protein
MQLNAVRQRLDHADLLTRRDGAPVKLSVTGRRLGAEPSVEPASVPQYDVPDAATLRRRRRRDLAVKVVVQWKWVAAERLSVLRGRNHYLRSLLQTSLRNWQTKLELKRRAWDRSVLAGGRLRYVAQRRGLSSWIAHVHNRAASKRRLSPALTRRVKLAVAGRQCLRQWQQRSLSSRAFAAQHFIADRSHSTALLRIALRQWRSAASAARRRAALTAQALSFWAAHQQQRALRGWVEYCVQRRQQRQQMQALDRWHNRTLQQRALRLLTARFLRAIEQRDLHADSAAHRFRSQVHYALKQWRSAASTHCSHSAAHAQQRAHMQAAQLRSALRRWQQRSSQQRRRRVTAEDAVLCLRGVRAAQAVSRWHCVSAAAAQRAAVTAGVCTAWAQRKLQRGMAHWRSAALHREAEERAAAVKQAQRTAAAHAVASAQRRALVRFAERTQAAQRRRHTRRLAAAFAAHVLLLRHYEAWRCVLLQAQREAAQTAAAASVLQRSCLQRALLHWHRALLAEAKQRRAALPLLQQCFAAWQQYSQQHRSAAVERESAAAWHCRHTARAALQAWREQPSRAQLQRQRTSAAQLFRRTVVAQQGLQWWGAAASSQSRHRSQCVHAAAHCSRSSTATALQRWREHTARAALQSRQTARAIAHSNRSALSSALRAWRQCAQSRALRRAVQAARCAAVQSALQQRRQRYAFEDWLERHRKRAVQRIAVLRARGHAGTVLLRRVLAAWKAAVSVRRRAKALQARAVGHRYLALERRAFGGTFTPVCTHTIKSNSVARCCLSRH